MRSILLAVLLAGCEGATVDAGPGSIAEAACLGAIATFDVPADPPEIDDDGKKLHSTWETIENRTKVVCEDVRTSGGDGVLDIVVTWTGKVYDDPHPEDAVDEIEWFADTMVKTYRDVAVRQYDQGWMVVD